MAHFPGQVLLPSGERIGYFEYNGTVDLACTRIYDLEAEVSEHWRDDNMRECQCGSEPTEVVLRCIGGGFGWSARACLTCHAIVDGREPMVENVLNQ